VVRKTKKKYIMPLLAPVVKVLKPTCTKLAGHLAAESLMNATDFDCNKCTQIILGFLSKLYRLL